jgi:hypothetical protein
MLRWNFSGTFRALLPGAVIGRERATPWHSLTFSGERRSWEMRLEGPDCCKRVKRFAAEIAEYEFALPSLLVDDIVVTDPRSVADGSVTFTVEALLLDEDV